MVVFWVLAGAAACRAVVLFALWRVAVSRSREEDPVGVGGRPRPPAARVAGLLLLAAVAAFEPAETWRAERLAATAAARVSEVEAVEVRCHAPWASLAHLDGRVGWVEFAADGTAVPVVHLTWRACWNLRSYVRPGPGGLGDGRVRPTGPEIDAVHTVTHEAVHVSGQQDEQVTECRAVQRDRDTALALGAAPAGADLLARLYARGHLPLMPDGYRSPECRRGGALDERLPHPPW